MTDRSGQEMAVRWHLGEKALQRSIGADTIFAGLESRIFHTHLSEQQRAFFAELRFIVVGAVGPRWPCLGERCDWGAWFSILTRG